MESNDFICNWFWQFNFFLLVVLFFFLFFGLFRELTFSRLITPPQGGRTEEESEEKVVAVFFFWIEMFLNPIILQILLNEIHVFYVFFAFVVFICWMNSLLFFVFTKIMWGFDTLYSLGLSRPACCTMISQNSGREFDCLHISTKKNHVRMTHKQKSDFTICFIICIRCYVVTLFVINWTQTI